MHLDHRYIIVDPTGTVSVKAASSNTANEQSIVSHLTDNSRQTQVIYAYINKNTGYMAIKSAFVTMEPSGRPNSGDAHVDDIHRVNMVFNSNYITNDFSYSLKTDAMDSIGG